MTAHTESVVPAVTLVRTINAPVAKVFRAWIDPLLIQRWLAPVPYAVTQASADPRPGGKYRIEVTGPNGELHVTTGEYREVVPDQRLVQTWRYDGPHGPDHSPSLLTVEFRELRPGVTELTLTHARARDLAARELLASGWISCLDRLAALLPTADGRPVTVSRRLAASADSIFAIWTTPELMRRWGPDVVSMDPRPGGRFRQETHAGGEVYVVHGEYLSVVPGQRLVMTWIGQGPNGAPPVETLVSVDLTPVAPGQTEIRVTEEPIAAGDAKATAAAWDGVLRQLDDLLGRDEPAG